MKKILSILMSTVLILGLAACGAKETEVETPNGSSEENRYSDVKIGVLGYMQSGETLDAMTAYLDALSEDIGFSYDYVVGNNYDEQTNITAVQNLIASGVDGIIMAIGTGIVPIMEECENAGVYVAGFNSSFDDHFDIIKDNKYFLGTVNDGLYEQSSIGEKAAELVIEDGVKNVGVVTFPLNYFPQHLQVVEAFTAVISEHNKEADEEIKVYETTELNFSPLEETYLKSYPEVDSILGLASGFVYPTLVSAGRTDINLYGMGFKKDDVPAFEKGEIRMMTFSNIEALTYSVAMILNEVTEMPYADKPTQAERLDTSIVFVTNDEELKALQNECLYFTADMEQSFVSVEEFKQYLTGYNDKANYSDLKELLLNMSMEDLMKK